MTPLAQRTVLTTKVDLDEDDDRPYAVQLRDTLSKQAVRVIDLFREWDEDGDGTVSKLEFRKAMPMIGLDVPLDEIDKVRSPAPIHRPPPTHRPAPTALRHHAHRPIRTYVCSHVSVIFARVLTQLFDEWDPDGSGVLELRELNKLLRRGGEVTLDAKMQVVLLPSLSPSTPAALMRLPPRAFTPSLSTSLSTSLSPSLSPPSPAQAGAAGEIKVKAENRAALRKGVSLKKLGKPPPLLAAPPSPDPLAGL